MFAASKKDGSDRTFAVHEHVGVGRALKPASHAYHAALKSVSPAPAVTYDRREVQTKTC
jgi:hypothetical protein